MTSWRIWRRSASGACLVAGLVVAWPAVATAQVSYDRLLRAREDPGNWLMHSGQYDSQRFSTLDQIERSNVARLRLAWVRQLQTLGQVETSPLVVDGVMYATTPEDEVLAIDARTGQVFWSYRHPVADALTLCCSKQNRGVAMLGDTLYLATLDAHLVALDARTGFVVWDVTVADHLSGYSMTAAPLVVKDLVVTGIGGGEFGIRGFVDAYDARTGDRRWRTYTIPAPGEPGHDTWTAGSWQTGGGSTWMTGSFDPDLNLIYWGVGNPGPDWNGEPRPGDNLYSDSLIALDADTGRLKWHFQFTPHDMHDWDACQVPVLFDAAVEGRPRKLVAFANRNGFFYLLDRETGEFLLAEAYAKQTWAERIDERGRPVRRPNMEPSEHGTLVFPDVNGASNWWSPSYSPLTGLFYTTAYDGASTYFKAAEVEYAPGTLFVGGSHTKLAPPDAYLSAIRAIDPLTAERKWEFQVEPKSMSGVLSTAGQILFAGTLSGHFLALDAERGTLLWRQALGGNIIAAPVTYLVDDRQQVSIAAGNAMFTFTLAE